MKRIGFLALLLVLLIGVYVFATSYDSSDSFTPPPEIAIEQWGSDIDGITFTFPDQEIALEKSTGNWMVNGFKADTKRIDDLLAAFAEAEVSSRVSTNSQNHSRFEVDDAGVRMTLFANGESIQELVVGKSAGGESIYARLPEDDSVYVINGIAQYLISEEEAIWRDRKIITLEPSQIRAVSYSAGRNDWELTRTENGWAFDSDPATLLDGEKTESWLARLRSLQAIEFPEVEVPGARLGSFRVEEGSVSALTEGREYEVYESEEADRVIVRDQEQMYYAVQESLFEDLFKSSSELTEELTPTEEESEE